MHSDPSFEPLAAAEGGPSLVVRHDDTVLRPAEPWTPTIHALLRHLEAVGFTGAPRVVGDGYDGHGNEVLTYVEGEVRHPHPWSDDDIGERNQLPDPRPERSSCGSSSTATTCPPPSGPASSPT